MGKEHSSPDTGKFCAGQTLNRRGTCKGVFFLKAPAVACRSMVHKFFRKRQSLVIRLAIFYLPPMRQCGGFCVSKESMRSKLQIMVNVHHSVTSDKWSRAFTSPTRVMECSFIDPQAKTYINSAFAMANNLRTLHCLGFSPYLLVTFHKFLVTILTLPVGSSFYQPSR